MKIDLRNRKQVILGLVAIGAVLFVAGMAVAFHARHDTICPDGKVPIAQRGGVIGQTEYLCHGGKVVTK